MKKEKLHKIELSEYEYELLMKDSLIIKDILRTLLATAKRIKASYFLPMRLTQLTELIGLVAGEANHAKGKMLQNDLNDLCDYLESIENQLKKEQN